MPSRISKPSVPDYIHFLLAASRQWTSEFSVSQISWATISCGPGFVAIFVPGSRTARAIAGIDIRARPCVCFPGSGAPRFCGPFVFVHGEKAIPCLAPLMLSVRFRGAVITSVFVRGTFAHTSSFRKSSAPLFCLLCKPALVGLVNQSVATTLSVCGADLAEITGFLSRTFRMLCPSCVPVSSWLYYYRAPFVLYL